MLAARWVVVMLVVVMVVEVVLGSEAQREAAERGRRRGNRRRSRIESCTRVEAFKKKLKGNFCPYTVSKMVSCKVVNGTETYTGRVAVGQRSRLMTMTRPHYSITFREVQETAYGCCPGFHGDNCDNRCFNCTQIQHLESRVRTLEAKLLRSPSVSLPPLQNPVIQMGLPDTSHVQDHPLNGKRGRGRGRGSNRGRNNRNSSRHRGRGSDRRVSGRRGGNEVLPEETYEEE
uniref:EMI domain-containing protein n=1 Tax=Scylla olivacea TaxID=85551 RepID=A0A0P4W3W6_SCYOL